MSLQNWLLSFICRLVLWAPRLPRVVRAAFLALGVTSDGRAWVSQRRLLSLYLNCSDESLPAGSFVECGVAKGASLSMMSLASDGKRYVWGFDSFEGMPALTAEDKGDGRQWVGKNLAGSQKEAQATLDRFSVAGKNVNLVRGWFDDTLPGYVAKVAPIAVLRLDADWHKATKYCLEMLYDSVLPGGYVIIDDYFAFAGCKDAVDEFRAARGIVSPLVTVEPSAEVYWRKE
jgi:hypothetical protein